MMVYVLLFCQSFTAGTANPVDCRVLSVHKKHDAAINASLDFCDDEAPCLRHVKIVEMGLE